MASPLLRRAFMFLEDGDWVSADEYCEKVLDMEPENAEAYLGKLMAELCVNKRELLADCAEPFDHKPNYVKAQRFGDSKLHKELQGYTDHIKERNEQERQESIYNQACDMMRRAGTEEQYKYIASSFDQIAGYRDAEDKAIECREMAETVRKDNIYNAAVNKMSQRLIDAYVSALHMLEKISGWKDADDLILVCQQKIEKLNAQAEAERLARERAAEQARIKQEKEVLKRKWIRIILSVVVVVAAAFLIVTEVIIPNQKYDAAMDLMAAGKYEEALGVFSEIATHKDSAEQIKGLQLAIKHAKYDAAVELMNEGKYVDAYDAFIALNGHKDSAVKADSIFDKAQAEKRAAAKVGDYITFGNYEQDNNTSNGKEDIEWLVLAKKNDRLLVISRYALDCKPYNDEYTDVTWETCTLRKWLNNDFLNAAFSSAEKAMIPTVTVSADKNPDYSTKPGRITQDKVFLPSITEVNKYFTSDSVRQCKPTAYAEKQGTYKSINGFCWWWLRSPGNDQNYTAGLHYDGNIHKYGDRVNSSYDAVRPALWINLEP